MAKQLKQLHPVVRRFIAEAGGASQSLGFGRVVGQIYAYLYFAQDPKNLNDLQDALGISKGSASMGVRQLEQWEAVRRVWIKGDRKDYYQALDTFGRIIRKCIADTVAVKMRSASAIIADALEEIDANDGNAHLRDRIEHLDDFRERAAKVWDNPLFQRLLK